MTRNGKNDILKNFTAEEQKNIAEELTKEAIAKLEQADEIITNLVNNNELPKHEYNKLYNIILQLKAITE